MIAIIENHRILLVAGCYNMFIPKSWLLVAMFIPKKLDGVHFRKILKLLPPHEANLA